jgi:hypothetical protein
MLPTTNLRLLATCEELRRVGLLGCLGIVNNDGRTNTNFLGGDSVN